MSESPEVSIEEVEALRGPAMIEFGTSWCGHCARAQPLIAEAMATAKKVRHIKVEDGPGRRIGRHYKVKLWPTLVFLQDGTEVSRLVRPASARDIVVALNEIGGSS